MGLDQSRLEVLVLSSSIEISVQAYAIRDNRSTVVRRSWHRRACCLVDASRLQDYVYSLNELDTYFPPQAGPNITIFSTVVEIACI